VDAMKKEWFTVYSAKYVPDMYSEDGRFLTVHFRPPLEHPEFRAVQPIINKIVHQAVQPYRVRFYHIYPPGKYSGSEYYWSLDIGMPII
jgi:hypothetical protein